MNISEFFGVNLLQFEFRKFRHTQTIEISVHWMELRNQMPTANWLRRLSNRNDFKFSDFNINEQLIMHFVMTRSCSLFSI